MGLKEKMIKEINLEIKKNYSKNSVNKIDEETIIKTNEFLVDALIGFYNKRHPSEKKAAEAFINNISKIIKE